MTTDTTGRGLWHRYVIETQQVTDAASDRYRADVPSQVGNRKVVIILIAAAVALTVLNFGATTKPEWFVDALDWIGLESLAESSRRAFFESDRAQINSLVFWGVLQVFSYVAIPILAIKLILRERIADYGTRRRGILRSGRVYLVLFAVSVPFILVASTTVAFQRKYPFYDLAPGESLWPYMVLWWVVYAAQFVALEFFFRGFLVHGLKWRLGFTAVFVMIVPYTMLHFTKPMLEALAAIAGGFVLGTLSLKTRSIWWGAALHLAVAGTMDVLALIRKDLLF